MGFDCAYISWGFCDGFSSRCLRVQRCETFWKFALFSPPCPPPKLCKNSHFFLLLHPYNTLDRSAGECCSVPLPPRLTSLTSSPLNPFPNRPHLITSPINTRFVVIIIATRLSPLLFLPPQPQPTTPAHRSIHTSSFRRQYPARGWPDPILVPTSGAQK